MYFPFNFAINFKNYSKNTFSKKKNHKLERMQFHYKQNNFVLNMVCFKNLFGFIFLVICFPSLATSICWQHRRVPIGPHSHILWDFHNHAPSVWSPLISIIASQMLIFPSLKIRHSFSLLNSLSCSFLLSLSLSLCLIPPFLMEFTIYHTSFSSVLLWKELWKALPFIYT